VTGAPGSAGTYREAVREGLRDALTRDPLAFLMGQDIGRYGGSYACTAGLLEEFGEDRVRDAPLSELSVVGAAIGAAMAGLHPVVEVMTINFSLLALDQLVNTAAPMRHMSGGAFGVPMVLRTVTGGGRQVAAQHSHSLEGWFAHVPGLRVLAPATVTDARGMLWPALQDPDPVVIVEHSRLYPMRGEPGDGSVSDILHAAVRREGDDVTVVAHGAAVWTSLEAADALAEEGIGCEVVDLRVLRPLDRATVAASVRRTGRAVVVDEGWHSVGLSAEVAAEIAETAFADLRAPVARVCGAEVPMPYAAHLERATIPQADDVVAAVRSRLRYRR
jgi:pyruvate dehydrogenase E1 component beta subunit